jgi:hypothetical protein
MTLWLEQLGVGVDDEVAGEVFEVGAASGCDVPGRGPGVDDDRVLPHPVRAEVTSKAITAATAIIGSFLITRPMLRPRPTRPAVVHSRYGSRLVGVSG